MIYRIEIAEGADVEVLRNAIRRYGFEVDPENPATETEQLDCFIHQFVIRVLQNEMRDYMQASLVVPTITEVTP